MGQEVSCSWKGGMAFEASVSGHRVLMDAGPDFGGGDTAPRPKPLLLAALAGCSGMDVVSLLRKMRQPPSWFELSVEAEVAPEHPKLYTSMVVVYRFKAADGLEADKVEKAVRLSQERYCGVSALFRLAIPLTYRIEYL